MKSLLLVLALASPWALAQDNNKANVPTSRDAYNTHEDALALFVRGNTNAAIATLNSTNISKSNTPEAALEAAQRLAGMALSFHNRRDQFHAAQAANLALPALNQAIAQLAQMGKKAAAASGCETLGNLYTSVFSDNTAALSAYKQAVLLNPQSPRAQQEVDKREKTETELTKKRGGAGS